MLKRIPSPPVLKTLALALSTGAILLGLLSACAEPPPSPPRAASLTVSPGWAALLDGDSTRLIPTALDSTGDTVPNTAIAWSSADTTIATVNHSGLVHAASLGFTMITARWDKFSVVTRIVVTPPVLVGAGDIANCGPNQNDSATARLLDALPGIVFTAGDNAYSSGTSAQFAQCYDPTWGRHKPRTRPSPGNHDYRAPGASGYFDYFGVLAGDARLGYYTYRLGAWQIYSLNSNVAMHAGSAQEQWLRNELSLHPARCSLAYWHHPRFSSGRHGSSEASDGMWRALYDANADVIIVGHDHTYERFAPQTPDAVLDSSRGIRQFVAGTGGASFYEFPLIVAHSEFRQNTAHGVLKLTLDSARYSWQFVRAPDGAVLDSGTTACH